MSKKLSLVNGLKILVAEDDPDYRAVLRESLEAYGHEVVAAANGVEAYDLLEHFPADLIISDIHMPRCSGTQLHEMIRGDERLKSTPFIYITAYTILRLSTPLERTGLDFMVNKVPCERLLFLVSDLSRKRGGPWLDPLGVGVSP